ncbi:MAG: dephospho-CoA kinase [Actinomycetota bacterium]
MLLVGLTGGIGSGKSTAARMFASRGAVVLDSDVLARAVVQPGTPGFDAVIARFGGAVLAPDGSLDRDALAHIVFADEAARADLEAIVHPEVRRRIAETVTAHADTDDVVVVDSPLLIETGAHESFSMVIVVTASVDARIARLTTRGMSEDDVRARMHAQMPLEEKEGYADVVLDNGGSEAELEAQIDRLWADLRVRALSSPA